MRLVTRSDFDGLVCGALLLEAGVVDHWKFAHPKDLQDGLVEINEDDCLANAWSLPGNIKGKAGVHRLAQGSFMNTTAARKSSHSLMT